MNYGKMSILSCRLRVFIPTYVPDISASVCYTILTIQATADMGSKEKNSMQQVKLDEATTRLPSLIDAAVRGEVVLITTDDRQTIQLVPLKHGRHPRRFGSARGLIQMADDFDAPLDDVREYMA